MEQFFSQWGPASTTFWVRAIWSLLVFGVVAWIAHLGRLTAQKRLVRARAHPNAVLLVERAAQFGVLILGGVIVLGILGIDWSALAAGFGLVTVALTLSFQDILRGLIAGIYLLIERSFVVGELVKVGDAQGVIEDVGLRTTTLRSENGERIVVPNLVIFTSIVIEKHGLSEAEGHGLSKGEGTSTKEIV